MPFLLAEILNFQGSTHHIGVGSFSNILFIYNLLNTGIYKGITDLLACQHVYDQDRQY